MAQVHVWRDILRACRLALPPLVAALVLVGTVRLVAFMKAYAPGLSIPESLSLARSMGRLDSLAAPFLVASVWLAVYPLLVGLRWAIRSHEQGRAHRPTVRSSTVKASPPVTSRATTRKAPGVRRPTSAA